MGTPLRNGDGKRAGRGREITPSPPCSPNWSPRPGPEFIDRAKSFPVPDPRISLIPNGGLVGRRQDGDVEARMDRRSDGDDEDLRTKMQGGDRRSSRCLKKEVGNGGGNKWEST